MEIVLSIALGCLVVVFTVVMLKVYKAEQRYLEKIPVRMELTPGLSSRELAEAFLGAETSPVWRGVMSVVDEHVVEAGNDVIDPRASQRDIDRGAAAQAALLALKRSLLERCNAARDAERIREMREQAAATAFTEEEGQAI